MTPLYISAYKNGSLKNKADELFSMLKSCRICPRKCGIDRLRGFSGFCKTGRNAQVYSYMLHHGEEPAISGKNGSGTIFFAHCNMACLYCQNYEFSQEKEGRGVEPVELARIMLELQEKDAHNINLVTPTHVLPQIIAALVIAAGEGLNIPLVYNTSGYELKEMIALLEGIIDIYLPDMRYGLKEHSLKYSFAPEYPRYNQEAIKEMHRQVGLLKTNPDGIALSGLLIRHLVLPNQISDTKIIMDFIQKELSPETYISLMSQYTPYYKAPESKELTRRLTRDEYEEAESIMDACGLHNGWVQEIEPPERFAGVHIKANFKP